jgi:HEAT repeat protein
VLSAVVAWGAEKPLTPEQELELKLFSAQLTDPTRSPITKTEAAELLLMRTYPRAAETAKKFLEDTSNRPAQAAVAEAVAKQSDPNRAYVEPLMTMLMGTEPTVRVPAARALAAYKDHGVLDKLLVVVRDRKVDNAIRLVMIAGLQRVLDQKAVDALVGLVEDPDPAIRGAAAESLAKLTNIRAFGPNAARWRSWWDKSKNKPASEWLADLAESLGREKTRLEDENAKLRQRLATAMMDCYAATAAAQQDKVLMGFLKDPLPDVRLVGVTLADRRIASGGVVSEELRLQVRAMLTDDDPQARRAASLLEANVGDPNAVDVLLGRLKIEETPEVKQGLLGALGQLRDTRALGPILTEVLSKDEPVAAAAAGALARGVSTQPLKAKLREEAVQTLLQRYGKPAGGTANGDALREALLMAMGMVADKRFTPALRAGLADPAATVRLAAVKGLAMLGDAEQADALTPLAADEDRGVRQAVIDALGTLNGSKCLPTILQRTDPAAESDAAVREKAWAVAMVVLAKANATALAEVCDALADRQDAASQRIQLRLMLVQALKTDKSPDLPLAQRKLASALMGAARPAEAAPLLAEAYAAYVAARNAQAQAVYLEWIDSLLRANDPTVVKAMSDTARAAEFAESADRLTKRLLVLQAEGRYAPIVLVGGEAARLLAKKLSEAQRKALDELVADAAAKQTAADRARVTQLATQLLAADAAAAKAAAAELKAMGDRAIAPLVVELRKVASAVKVNEPAEKAILDVLMQIAPKLTGYDPKAPRAERLDKINDWLKTL